MDKQQVIHDIVVEIESARQRRAKDSPPVEILAVSKTRTPEEMEEIAKELLTLNRAVQYGENYVQEFKKKAPLLTVPYSAHLIGHLQKNKVRDAVALFSCIESIDSEELLRLVQKEAKRQGKNIEFYIQVNISEDPRKSGVRSAVLSSVVETFFQCAQEAPEALTWRGLMTITALYETPEMSRGDFKKLAAVRTELLNNTKVQEYFTARTFGLSMGMSSDYQVAIEEGATLVRIGTALFGERAA